MRKFIAAALCAGMLKDVMDASKPHGVSITIQ